MMAAEQPGGARSRSPGLRVSPGSRFTPRTGLFSTRLLFGVVVCMTAFIACGDSEEPTTGTVLVIANDVLEVHIADNGTLPAYENHMEGLHGIVRLRHASRPDRDIFIQTQAGLNYETSTLAGVVDNSWEETAEPRYSPMDITRVDDWTVELHQPPTERKEVEARLRYSVDGEPPALDFDFTFTLHKAPQTTGAEPDFQTIIASYIYDPADPTMYFIGHTTDNPDSRWLRANADYHGDFWVEEADGSLRHPAYSADRPFIAGIVDRFLVVVMVNPTEVFGFWYSPNGGWDRDFSSPAWDLNLRFYNLSGPPYVARVRGRLLVLRDGTLDDVEAQYQAWLQSVGG